MSCVCARVLADAMTYVAPAVSGRALAVSPITFARPVHVLVWCFMHWVLVDSLDWWEGKRFLSYDKTPLTFQELTIGKIT